MTEPDPTEAMREMAREVLREVVESASLPTSRPGGVPRVPPPPVAAVLRPSTWTGPAVPGEVIGDGATSAREPAPEPGVEAVTLDTDEDLERFVRALLLRLESPHERRAIRAGQVRFTLRRPAVTAAAPASPARPAPPAGAEPETIRIPKGAVTERVVRDAAQRRARLVLARGAVLTPLARDRARAMGVEIEQEGRC